MSPSSSGESSNQSLKPALRVALGSLDVQLDAELARYRRLSKAAKPLRVPVTSTVPKEGVAVVEESVPEPPALKPEEPSTQPEATIAARPQPLTIEDAKPEPPAAPPQPELPPMVPPPAAAAPVTPVTPTSTNGAASLPPQDESTPTLASVSADSAPTAPPTPTPDTGTTEPKDYLESSEELLKTTGDPLPNTDGSNAGKGMSGILTIGSVLLLLLATATLGYAIFKPASVARFLGRSPQTETANAPNSEDASQEANMLPPSPDLSKEEFKDLELDNLGSVNPSPTPVPRATPTPTTPPAASATGSTSTLNNLDRVLEPDANSSAANPTNTPSPNATPTPNPDVPKPPVDADDRYYDFHFVVVEYDPQAWEKVRETVPDAYLRQFPVGERIQVGAFDTDEEAQQLVERLTAQGLNAQAYQPE